MEEKIRQQIKKIIENRKMTQDEFADLTNIPRTSLNQLLNGSDELTERQRIVLDALGLKTGLLDINEKGKYELSDEEIEELKKKKKQK